MNTEQILKVLKNERECIKRQIGTTKDGYYVSLCDRNCDKCDLCLPDNEILEVYDHLINIVECEAIYIKCDVSEEEKRKLFLQLQRAGFTPHPDLIKKYGLKRKMPNKDAPEPKTITPNHDTKIDALFDEAVEELARTNQSTAATDPLDNMPMILDETAEKIRTGKFFQTPKKGETES